MEYLLIIMNWIPEGWLSSLSGWHILFGAVVIVVLADVAVRIVR